MGILSDLLGGIADLEDLYGGIPQEVNIGHLHG